ncbi:MAG: hypothetical protein AB7T22_03535 [Calditrichaceae bacterium]
MPEVVYSDPLVEIRFNKIIFKMYYFPTGAKHLSFSEIKNIVVKEPSLLSGKWRIFGSGDFKTWFPCDFKRPERDKIFILTRAKGWWRIGFTVEDSERVIKIFKDQGLLYEFQPT